MAKNVSLDRLIIIIMVVAAVAGFFSLVDWSVNDGIGEVDGADDSDFDDGKLKYKITSEDNKTVAVVGCVSSQTTVTIPNTVSHDGSTYNVTSIGSKAFYSDKTITKITIGKKIERIDTLAFCATTFSEITIPENVKQVGDYSFASSSLTKVTFSNCAAAIGTSSFYACHSLANVNFGSSIVSIGDTAFLNCYSLSSITIPGSVKSIGTSAFFGCTGISSITIPGSVKSIGSNAFEGCSSLASVDVQSGVQSFGEQIFKSCQSLSTINLPDTLGEFNLNIFDGCKSLKAINVQEGNEIYSSKDGVLIKDTTVLKCPVLKDDAFVMPSGVLYVADNAFAGCSKLPSITISGTLLTLNALSFDDCKSLKEIIVSDGDGNFSSEDGVLFDKDKTVLIRYPMAKSGDSYTIRYVQTIYKHAFYSCVQIKKLTICTDFEPDATFGADIFKFCDIPDIYIDTESTVSNFASLVSGIHTVTFSDKVKTIAHNSFNGTYLKGTITIPDSVEYIGNNAFSECIYLDGITLGSGLTYIGNSAFKGLHISSPIKIPDSVKSIGKNAFEGCWNINSLSLGSSLTFIGDYAFKNCITTRYGSITVNADMSPEKVQLGVNIFEGSEVSRLCVHTECINPDFVKMMPSLTSVEFNEKVITISDGLFKDWSTLKCDIVIPDSVEYIGASAFEGCPLTAVSLGTGLTYVGDGAFRNCGSVKKLTVSMNFDPIEEYLGDEVFKDTTFSELCVDTSCLSPEFAELIKTGLTKVTFTDKVKAIADKTFMNVYTLAGDIRIPDSVTSIGKAAFEGCGIKSVQLGNGVTSIGVHAFYHCSSLTSVTFGNGAISIEAYAFYECRSLRVSMPSNVVSIGDNAFGYCLLPDSLVIPDSAESVGTSIFYMSEGSTNLTLGSGLISLADGAFSYCESIRAITVRSDFDPNSTFIGKDIFEGCSVSELCIDTPCLSSEFVEQIKKSLTTVTFTERAEKIVDKLFMNATNLTGNIVIPNSIGYLGVSAFEGCLKITGISFGTLNEISDYAFKGCSSISELIIPNNILLVGNNAFEGCTGIVSLSCSDYLVKIGNDAFSGCSSITSLTFSELSRLTHIGDRAFEGCTSLGEVMVPADVEYLGVSAFEGCSGITSVTIGYDDGDYQRSKLSFIGSNAFKDCGIIEKLDIVPNFDFDDLGKNIFENSTVTELVVSSPSLNPDFVKMISGLTTLTFTPNVDCIEDETYKGITTLTGTISMPRIQTIGASAFEGCTGITSLSFGTKMKSIGACAFKDCTGITGKVEVATEGERVMPIIGASAFEGCTGITSLGLWDYKTVSPEQKGVIGDYAFKGCTGIDGELVLPAKNIMIGKGAFEGCSKITSVSIGADFNFIDSTAFEGCTSLGEFTVNSSNTSYSSANGVLFNKNKTELLSYPIGKTNDSYTIPNTVTKIRKGAFYGCINLASITFGTGLTAIEDEVFKGCSSLVEITIPDSMKQIGASAFEGCTSLTTIAFGTGLTTIGEKAFKDCISIAEITIPNSVTQIGAGAFEGCTELSSITFGTGLTAIEDEVFKGCSSLAEITIPNSVTQIGASAFEGCTELSSITFGTDLTTIGEKAFKDCISITELILPNNISSIKASAFEGCTELTSITFGNGLGNIGDSAFKGCYSISELTIPKSVMFIGSHAFEGCKGITVLTIGYGVISIGDEAFKDCSKIEMMTVSSNFDFGEFGDGIFDGCSIPELCIDATCLNPEFLSLFDGLTTVTFTTGVLSIAANTFKGMQNLTCPIEITGNINSIGASAFEGCSNITSLTLGSRLVTIGEKAFMGCSSIDSAIDIPDQVTSIGISAFEGCSKITSVTFGKGLKIIDECVFKGCSSINGDLSIGNNIYRINDGAFEGCSKIAAVTLSEKVTNIGNFVFKDCSSLAEIVLPEFVRTVGESTFEGCTELSSITFGAGLESIGKNAFKGCSSLLEIALVDKVSSVGESAFEGCSSVTSLTLGSFMVSIGKNAFKDCSKIAKLTVRSNFSSPIFGDGIFDGCSIPELCIDAPSLNPEFLTLFDGLTTVTFTERVTEIREETFKGMTNLNCQIAIPYTVKTIGASAFEGCSNITSLTIGTGLESIGDKAFKGCSSLPEIVLPDKVSSVGASAFEGCSKITSVTLGSKMTAIGDAAFKDCIALKTVTVLSNFDSPSFGDGIFEGCGITELCIDAESLNPEFVALFEGLTTVSFTENAMEIDVKPFKDIPSLKEFVVADDNPNYSSKDGVLFDKDMTELISYPMGKTDDSYTVSGSVVSINASAFEGCASLTQIILGAGLESVGDAAFKNCKNIAILTVSSDFKTPTFGDGIFEGCGITELCIDAESLNPEFVALFEGLTTVTFTDNAKTILPETFKGMKSLACPIELNKVITVGASAFEECSNITSVTIGTDAESIGAYAFRGCSSIEEFAVAGGNSKFCSENGVLFDKDMTELITYPMGKTDDSYKVPDSASSIAASAFEGCANLTQIILGAGLESVGDAAFKNCVNIGKLTVSSNFESPSFGTGIFEGCSIPKLCIDAESLNPEFVALFEGLTTVTFTENVITISQEMFKDMTNLVCPIVIPDSVTTICASAFEGCTGITSLTLGSGLVSIGNSAFNGCSSIEGEIVVYDRTATIGDRAFEGCSKITSVTLGKESVQTTNSAFGGYSAELTTLSMGSSVFDGCDSLKSVVIGKFNLAQSGTAFEKGLNHITVLAGAEGDGFSKLFENYAFYDKDGNELTDISEIAGHEFKADENGNMNENVAPNENGGDSNMLLIIGAAVAAIAVLAVAFIILRRRKHQQ